MVSRALFTVFLLATAAERLVELRVSNRHVQSLLAQGGQEHGQGHFPAMVSLHTALLIGSGLEVWLLERPFIAPLGFAMLALALAAQGLRWWCITTLGERWTTRVIVLPGRSRVTNGPYRWWSHPNYTAVVVEGFALPLIHTAWLTALAFTALNGALLTVRIRTENRALREAEA